MVGWTTRKRLPFCLKTLPLFRLRHGHVRKDTKLFPRTHVHVLEKPGNEAMKNYSLIPSLIWRYTRSHFLSHHAGLQSWTRGLVIARCLRATNGSRSFQNVRQHWGSVATLQMTSCQPGANSQEIHSKQKEKAAPSKFSQIAGLTPCKECMEEMLRCQ